MINLKNGDLEIIRTLMKSSEHTPSERFRAHCLYLADRGFVPIEISEILDITPRTVINIQNNYLEEGLYKAVNSDPRPGRPPKYDDRIKSELVAIVCSSPPEGFDRWTLELLSEKMVNQNLVDSISKETIRTILQEHDLKPWQQKMWCIGELDDEYIDRMEDVLNLYEQKHSKNKPLVCIDEKPVFLQEDCRDSIPMKSGTPKKVDHEYERKGSVNVFSMVEPQSGIYINKVTESKKTKDFTEFLMDISEYYSHAEKIILVMDNFCTHFKTSIIKTLGKEKGSALWDRFDVHYTPIHGSWLNQAEIAIGMYQRQCLGHSRIPDIETLEKKTLKWNQAINRKSIIIQWKFNSEKAREKFNYS